jgi:hypothetical protein
MGPQRGQLQKMCQLGGSQRWASTFAGMGFGVGVAPVLSEESGGMIANPSTRASFATTFKESLTLGRREEGRFLSMRVTQARPKKRQNSGKPRSTSRKPDERLKAIWRAP